MESGIFRQGGRITTPVWAVYGAFIASCVGYVWTCRLGTPHEVPGVLPFAYFNNRTGIADAMGNRLAQSSGANNRSYQSFGAMCCAYCTKISCATIRF